MFEVILTSKDSHQRSHPGKKLQYQHENLNFSLEGISFICKSNVVLKLRLHFVIENTVGFNDVCCHYIKNGKIHCPHCDFKCTVKDLSFLAP